MEISFTEVDRVTIPLILLLSVLGGLGYMLARRWPFTAWFIVAGVAVTAIVLVRALMAVFGLNLHPNLRRSLAVEAAIATALGIVAIVAPLYAAARARRRLQ
jgi:hypothetical protein